MSAIVSRIDDWKKSLLDLGKRNRLLNYKDTKRSNIKISSPELEELYQHLVLDEKSLSFPFSYIWDEDGEELENERIIPVDISTNRTIKEQQKTLKNLRDKARTAVEEQGVNILYLAFGFLQWTESLDSKQVMTSPIILVPVSISLESLTSPYVLKLHEDEIVINPTLIYKMEHDFGIDFPEFEPNENDIIVYLNKIQENVSFRGWKILTECGLSLFSFLKMNMYSDLELHKEKIITHPILKALAGDRSNVENVPEEYTDYDHDNNVKPIDIYQVVDADSSQQDAILYSKKGISFVLQGPPGTGKSQTITNIISEALADGKKVLFVSEKMAALEVVHKRLTQSGLDDFSLMLHSHKVNKKEVLSELNRTLNADRIRLQDDAIYQLNALEKQRERLNSYAKELHVICPPLNKSIYEITGKLAKLSDVPCVIFTIENVDEFSAGKLQQFVFLLTEYSKTVGKMTIDYKDNPWRSVALRAVTHIERQNIEKNIRDLLPKIKMLHSTMADTIQIINYESEITMNSSKILILVLKHLALSPKLPVEWFVNENILALRNKAEEYHILEIEYLSQKDFIKTTYYDKFFDLNAEQTKDEIENILVKINNVINTEHYSKSEEIYNSRTELEKELKIIKCQINHAEDDMNYLKDIGLNVDENTVHTLSATVEILEILTKDIKPTEAWFDGKNFSKNIELAKKYKSTLKEIDELTLSLLHDFDKEILDIDFNNIIKRYRAEYGSFLKIFKKEYRQDKKTIQALYTISGKKIDDATILAALNKVKDIVEKRIWLEENQNRISEFLGQYFLGSDTDWEGVFSSIEEFQKLIVECQNDVSDVLKNNMIQGSIDLKRCKDAIIHFEGIVSSEFLNYLNKIVKIESSEEKTDLCTIARSSEELLREIEKFNILIYQLLSTAKENISFVRLSEGINALMQVQQYIKTINDMDQELKNKFKHEYTGIDTDWESIIKKLNWMIECQRLNETAKLPEQFIIRACEDTVVKNDCSNRAKHLEDLAKEASKEWNYVCLLFDEKEKLDYVDLSNLMCRLEKCANNMSSLEEWIDYCAITEKCKNLGLGGFLEEVSNVCIDTKVIVEIFQKRFYRSWLDAMIPKYPSINLFRRRSQESVIEEFKNLDLLQMRIARIRVRERLLAKIPDINRMTAASDEIAILRRELNKQRRIMPLRKLFRTIPNLLMAIKPCLMMSPLSVSLFLQADSYDFDLIVFDEASQVHTEDSIGAIMRGKQIVIAGDCKQLPPTSFFAATTSDNDFDTDDGDENEETNVFESILDEASTILPERILKWHYRSRHESLIAFSNAKIYNHCLTTFPSTIEKVENNGVEYVYVKNGVYDRGGKKCNLEEAKEVSNLVFNHIKNSPNRTLGVITFSEAQQHAVENAIQQKRLQHPEYEAFFNEEKMDGFFIKNLENVQGDERDTIIFSIGYAKDINGVMYMNFGPLSRDGGYRRLNVAITRAKYNVKLVGSIYPTDIRLESTNSEGVKMLRSYIEFAIQGQKVLDTEISSNDVVNVDSPFEEAVYDFLIKNSYQVSTQVGCSGYRIDMAIKHPSLSGRFVIGIECDGATYHSSRTARERDRLRQTILEDIGWKIYRIWSTDWIKDPVTEGQRLLEAVEAAINDYIDESIETIHDDNSDFEDTNDKVLVAAIETIHIDDSTVSDYDFLNYEETNIWDVDRDYNDNQYLRNVIEYVVKKEFPIHFELLCKRVAPLFGNQKATVKVRNGVDFIMRQYCNSVLKKGEFCWLKDNDEAKVRIPTDLVSRPIQYIAVEELAEAMMKVISNSFGVEKDDLFVTTARIFGFNRTGGNIQSAMSETYEYLEKNNMIRLLDNKVALV
ncbi:Protein of unknown function [Anaerocolumna jejuensis DSM 15929]|uniref:AAA domain-containing protein n=1 Tax=Anaerocolumna jejuensis DSM 15929 TaxID=1121322 RepID=A0A1M6MAU4_9FIRM|nr:DUF4011 domain-containing protein [Anaerocolumna jejuensis]SHJ80608.1 Protein of unknown function [Anaerocolumna jejuensis DSM 15929]